MIETYRDVGTHGDAIVTIAIGEAYFEEWRSYALPLWKAYCENYDLGLYVVKDNLIEESHPKWKKATWQKLLIGKTIANFKPEVKNVCYLDTDILINPCAPNIFDVYDKKNYGLVSQIKNLPMPLELVMRQYVFLRHNYYSKRYPLDSVVFLPLPEQYKYSNLKPVDDSACAGLILFNVVRHSQEMYRWFLKYDNQTPSVTDGDQTHINWEIINTKNVQWLDYRFQALWVYEMAWKYSFLYTRHQQNKELIRECVEACLFSNYFLHFAGSWHESDMWLIKDILSSSASREMNISFKNYLEHELTGQPKGMVKP